MVGYAELSKFNTFTMDDVYDLVGNKKTASSLILRLTKKGLVRRIRNNLYSCVNISDGHVLASKYQIACAINNTAYISHHSAFEYFGITNQVYYEIYVSSANRFNEFVFEGITYKYLSSKFQEAVIEPKNTDGIRVTTIERTIIDSINDFEKISGLEEVLNSIDSIHYIDEKKLIEILDLYNLQFLYQKTGYLLEYYKSDFRLSDNFINYCKSKINNSTRYLTKDSTKYNDEWKLVVPENLFEITSQGGLPIV